MTKSSYQTELDNFFKVLNHWEIPERFVFKGSLSKSRKKLKYQAFTELNDHMNRYYYSNFSAETWHGFNLMAVDGTTARVPDEKEIIDHFGVWHSTKGKNPCPKARGSQMFDVLNKITVDALISPKSEGERELAAFHFIKLMPQDLVLLDRGYPAFWLFKLILSMNADFCARVSYKKWKVIRKFYDSGKKEQIVKLDPTASSVKKCFEMGLDKKTLKVRLIRVELDTGESEILITSLKDKKKFPLDLFAELYHLRWPVEEDYKTMKCRLQIENFTGKSVHSVYQDFHAKIFSKNLSAIIAGTVKENVQQKSSFCIFEHQVNFSQALSSMKNSIVLLFCRPKETVIEFISKICALFIKTTESIRPGRKYKRMHRVKQKQFHYAYKQNA